MSGVSFDTSELDQLAIELSNAGSKVKRLVPRELDKVATRFRDDARAAVPVDSGELQSSIHVEGNGDERSVVADARHAAFVEFGTSDTAPQPYMWPQIPAATRRLEEALEDIADPFRLI